MSHHLVVGAGGIGRSTVDHLVRLGHTVTLASRSGLVSERPWERDHPEAVTVVAADAADPDRLTELSRGAASIVNAVNPPKYTSWDTDWPPVATALLTAAERSGAGLVTVSNLYGYGRVDGPMREDAPLRPNGHKGELRARMWRDALALHEQGRIRAAELRASDYFGPGATRGTSVLNDFVLARAVSGSTVVMPMGRPDVPHSWTYLPDIGVLAAVLATDDRSWGQAWHVPTSGPCSIRQVVDDAARLADRRPARVWTVPRGVTTEVGAVVPLLRELRETRHQFERPFVLDSSRAERTFGLAPTPWEAALEATVAALAG
jgi:nucleoside-diphosphate-sugar epimerase